MSNPVATIGNSIPIPGDPTVVRKSYTLQSFDSPRLKTWTYSDGEDATTIDPTNKGPDFCIFQRFGDVVAMAQPDIIGPAAWDASQVTKSGFITAVHSIMPKIVDPSTKLVDNGYLTGGATPSYRGYWPEGGAYKDLFNWEMVTWQGAAPVATEWYQYIQVGGMFGAQYISTKKKNNYGDSTFVFQLNPPVDPPTSTDWENDALVVQGAFVLLLNITPLVPAGTAPQQMNAAPWSLKFECGATMGDVTLEFTAEGKLVATLVSIAETNSEIINLQDAAAKEGPPQIQFMKEKTPIVMSVVPVWNGIVVSCGGQESTNTVKVSSTYIPKLRNATWNLLPYSEGFDVTTPDDVEVDVGTGDENVIVQFGDTLKATAKNCLVDIAYQPLFFSKAVAFDQWFIANVDVPGVSSYEYNIYALWTKNSTDYSLALPLVVSDSGNAGFIPGTDYFYSTWEMSSDGDKYRRYAGEMFGYVLETVETQEFPILNDNGSFVLSSSGGTAGNPGDSDWRHYVQSINVTIGLSGSSGTITVDKYGVAGQDAIATQCIGAITIAMTGGYNTNGSSTPLFQGLAMGIGDDESPGGATWTIPLVGLEKKLDDICLINPPFLDGQTLQQAADFLCRYAGIVYDLSTYTDDPTVQLGVTSEVNSPRYDYKTGTSVKAALEEICGDVLHSFIVMDGKIYFYRIDPVTSLPAILGPDRSGGYDETTIVNINKTPDFEDLRTEIMVLGLQQVPDGKGTEVGDLPLYPLMETRTQTTVPPMPWAKTIVQNLQGATTQAYASLIADRIASQSRMYEMMGRLQIPGNAAIRPLDIWTEGGETLIIYSVSHNIDFQAKIWTTDLEFMRSAV